MFGMVVFEIYYNYPETKSYLNWKIKKLRDDRFKNARDQVIQLRKSMDSHEANQPVCHA